MLVSWQKKIKTFQKNNKVIVEKSCTNFTLDQYFINNNNHQKLYYLTKFN